MESKKVSIIIPVYNVEKYISKCLESVITQTYTNLEILVNNDGSTDNSYQICLEYAEKDSRIKLYSQENSGPGKARNAMIERATGEYILFVDSDDWISSTHVERLVALLEESNSDGSACGHVSTKSDSTEFAKKKKAKIIYYTGKQFADKITQLIGFRSFPWGRLIKKDFFNSKEMRFSEDHIFEDMFLMPKLFLSMKSLIYTTEPLYAYRHTANGICHSQFSLRRTDELDGYIMFTRYGLEGDCPQVVRNGALFFVLVYIKFKITMFLQRMDTSAYTEKYKPYFKIYLRMLLTKKYNHNDMIYKKLIPLR